MPCVARVGFSPISGARNLTGGKYALRKYNFVGVGV